MHNEEVVSIEEVRRQRAAAFLESAKQLSAKDWEDDPHFESRLDRTERTDHGLKSFLRQPPRDVLDELAKTDPNMRRQVETRTLEEVISSFRESTRSWYSTEKNNSVLIQQMAKQHLQPGRNQLTDAEAEQQLLDVGAWTVPNLRNAFKSAREAGLFEVRPGTVKTLSKEDLHGVAAVLALHGESAAISAYLEIALPGASGTIQDLFTKHGKVCSQAVYWVWSNSRPHHLTSEWDEFLAAWTRDKQSVLEMKMLDALWTEFREHRELNTHRTAPVAEMPRPEDLTDVELRRQFGELRLRRKTLS